MDVMGREKPHEIRRAVKMNVCGRKKSNRLTKIKLVRLCETEYERDGCE
jgi:hypothetical protein